MKYKQLDIFKNDEDFLESLYRLCDNMHYMYIYCPNM